MIEISYKYQDIVERCIQNSLTLGLEFEQEQKEVGAEDLTNERHLQLLQEAANPLLDLGKLLWLGSFRKETFDENKLKEKLKDWGAMVVMGLLLCSSKAKDLVKPKG